MLGRDPSRGKFGLGYGLSPKVIVDPHLLTAGTRAGAWSQHTRTDCRSRKRLGRHPSRQSFGTARRIPHVGAGSHLGSSLSPRRAVLTGGVSRRSGSVACVRTDASPNEVLARKCCTPARGKSTSTFDNCQSLTNPLCHCPRRYCVQTGVVLCAHAATSRLNEQIVDVAPRPAVVPVQGCRLRGDVRPLSTST